jgi:hypothetical protein
MFICINRFKYIYNVLGEFKPGTKSWIKGQGQRKLSQTERLLTSLNKGKRTGGKIHKENVLNIFKSENKQLADRESLDYKMGWQDGFTDVLIGY